MTANGWFQILFFSVAVLAVTKPMGAYLVRVFDGSMRWLAPVERVIYRVSGVDPDEDQHWTVYAAALLMFSALSLLAPSLVLRPRGPLPWSPCARGAVPDRQAFDSAASFTPTANCPSSSGETTMSCLSQMMHLAFSNFASAAAGPAAAE